MKVEYGLKSITTLRCYKDGGVTMLCYSLTGVTMEDVNEKKFAVTSTASCD